MTEAMFYCFERLNSPQSVARIAKPITDSAEKVIFLGIHEKTVSHKAPENAQTRNILCFVCDVPSFVKFCSTTIWGIKAWNNETICAFSVNWRVKKTYDRPASDE
jgi:hypothetical protein